MARARFFLTLQFVAFLLLSACGSGAREHAAPDKVAEPDRITCLPPGANGARTEPVSITLAQGENPADACRGKIVTRSWSLPLAANPVQPAAPISDGGAH